MTLTFDDDALARLPVKDFSLYLAEQGLVIDSRLRSRNGGEREMRVRVAEQPRRYVEPRT